MNIRQLLFGMAALSAAYCANAASVLMISVDGLKPEYVLDADSHGLKIPYLRSMVRDGTFAKGVTGVWPTVTYPSHTTLLTGVTPSEHGIYNNLEFDPRRTFGESWHWYATEIRSPTLWHAAHAAGLSTASVGWPVSVQATDVDTLLPEFWRINRLTADLAPSDAHLMEAVSRPEGLLSELESRLGPYIYGNDASPPGDVIKTNFAREIIKTRKPKFMTLHLSALDEEEHAHAPFSAEANLELEAIDGMLSQLFAAARANDPDAIALVVSDHGFAPLRQRVNLFPAFMSAGLLSATVDANSHTVKVNAWRATLWSAGGMAAVMLNKSADPGTGAEVLKVLKTLQADERNGIAAVLDAQAIKTRGGFPDAAYLVVMKPGFYLSGDPSGEAVVALAGTTGGHGFSPEYPEMRSSFFVAGTGIARHRDLGVIDMRQIAPTVAQLLNVQMPSAKAAPLSVRP
jgi:predicted AlkP superfamily pyrophosphatase or phosphodiesterase